MPLRSIRENTSLTMGLALIIAGMFVVAIGAQSYVALRDNANRDAQDADYAECLSDFAADLVRTIRVRTGAAGEVEELEAQLQDAEDTKNDALDRIILVVSQARAGAGFDDRFDAALDRRVSAQNRYDEVRSQVDAAREKLDETRAMNEYQSPRVTCER